MHFNRENVFLIVKSKKKLHKLIFCILLKKQG
jgi:hypothetical protein